MVGPRMFLAFYQKLNTAVVKYNGNTRIFSVPSAVCDSLIAENRSYIQGVIDSFFKVMNAQETLLFQFSEDSKIEDIKKVPDEGFKNILKTEAWNPITIPIDFDKDKAEIKIIAKNMQWSFNSVPSVAVLESGDEIRYFSIPSDICEKIFKYLNK
jgi:hypothetical protein